MAGPIWAYDVLLLLSFALAGCVAALWLRALGLTIAAALAGGLVFTLAPYRVAQSTGHLLGMIAFLIPAALYAIEKRRLAWAGLALAAIPCRGSSMSQVAQSRSLSRMRSSACRGATGRQRSSPPWRLPQPPSVSTP